MIELSAVDFDEFVKDGLSVIDFWAEYCRPCIALGPVFDKLAGKYSSVRFGKVNIETNHELAAKLGISSIPTIMLFKDGEKIASLVGLMPENKIVKEIEELKNT